MKKPWLLQRCKVQTFNSTIKTGDYLRLDYMGSSEFEWGAIPKFQRDIEPKLKSMIEHTHVYKDQTFFFFLNKGEDANEYRKFIEGIFDRTIQLKESARLSDPDVDVWMDLTNTTFIARKSEVLNNLKITVKNSVKFMNQQAKANK